MGIIVLRFIILANERARQALGERLFRLVRYMVSGGTAALFNFGILFILVHFGKMYYLYASMLAFTLSIAVSFTLQKFWTFRNSHLEGVHLQFARYLAIVLLNLILNTALVYFFVEKLGVWYLLAQVIATLIIAVIGYFGYRHFVFTKPTSSVI